MCKTTGTHKNWKSALTTSLILLTLVATTGAAVSQPASPEGDNEQVEALARALGRPPEEVEALGLSPAEVENLLAGLTEEVVVVGSRAPPRTVTESAVPVDVLSPADLSTGMSDLLELLRTLVPSFNVNTYPISDASTIVRPAILRNLAPDHTLVLVNGKRRHRSSLIDWHGGSGVTFGAQGPDISPIPAIALRQIELLRDGAAAQYGSDAIAGVMNFQLKDAPSGGAIEYNTGRFRDGGGATSTVAANAGLPLGAAGFANLSLEWRESKSTNRSAPRSDAIALIAAGNSDVESDTPQIWGSPHINDNLKLFGNFGYPTAAGVQVYGHTNYARKPVRARIFFRNPNTRNGIYTDDHGKTLLIGDVLRAKGTGSANCPKVTITDNAPDLVALQRVFDDPNCFSFQEVFPGGFTPQFIGNAQDMSLVGGVRGFTGDSFDWDVGGSFGAHETDLSIHNTVNPSLGPDTPTSFYLGSPRQRALGLHADFSYPATDTTNIAAGAEWRNEQFGITAGDRESWMLGPYGGDQGFLAGSNGIFGFGPQAAGTWSRGNVAFYGDVEQSGAEDDWTLGSAVRIEHFDDFGTTMNSKLSGRFGFVRGSLSSGFRAPTPGQQNAFDISDHFDPAVGDLVNEATIPSIWPAAVRRGGGPLAPEKSINYTAGVLFDGGQFRVTVDYFRVEVSDRLGVTSDLTLTDAEIDALLAAGVEAAVDLLRFRFFTNAFSTTSQGIDLVSTYVPLALRGNTTISGVLNYTDTQVTDNLKGVLNQRRLTEFAYALPRIRWNITLTQQVGRVRMLGRVNYFGGWYDWDSGFGQSYLPSSGIEQGFFDGKPIFTLEARIALGGGMTLAIGGRNALNTYSDESVRAMAVGEKYSEYTPWGIGGAYYYARLRYGWGRSSS